MKKKILIPIIIIILIVIISIIAYINSFTTIIIEVNPSIQIKINNNEKVVDIKDLNSDAEDIINDSLKGKELKEVIKSLVEELIDKHYTRDNKIVLLLYRKGIINNKNIERIIKDEFNKKDIYANIININKITRNDKILAKKYNISIVKASYINELCKNNKKLNIKELTNKPITELTEMKDTGNYCDDGYTLEQDNCIKEIGKEPAKEGYICPNGYYEYNGICYEEKPIEDGKNDVCDGDYILTNGKCIRTDKMTATGNCKSNDYIYEKDMCVEKVYIGDAYEYCRDPGRTLYDHKCLATKPTINGGCLGSDALLDGKCVNMYDDYYPSEWMCPNGQTNSRSDGSLLFPDNKCYEEKYVKPESYKCIEDYVLKDKECIREDVKNTMKERICPNNFTKVENNRCINYNNIKEKENGYYCDKENSRIRENECILYDIKNINHNKK